ncbi:MAG: ribonuclease Z [Clostridia bacterium]|nr:ribonuclease Z [Clostridia bacterium]
MRIVLFGSSHGVPEPHRKCSAAMVEVGENKYFIDMGVQVIDGLITRGIPIADVKGVFLTHMHGDHTNGLISFLDLCSWYFKDTDPAVYIPGSVETVTAAAQGWLKVNGTEMRPFRFFEVKEGVIFDDGSLRVTAYRTKHIDISYAYLLEAEGKRVFFSGDMCHQGPAQDFPVEIFAAPVDLAFCEAAHFTPMDYRPILEGKPLGKLVINHYSERFRRGMIELQETMTDIPVTFAADDMEFNV